MRKIVGILRPFDLQQKIFVYEDGNKIDSQLATVDNFEKIVLNLVQEYDIHQVDLTGPKQYARGIKEKIEKMNLQEYSNNTDFDINLI